MPSPHKKTKMTSLKIIILLPFSKFSFSSSSCSFSSLPFLLNLFHLIQSKLYSSLQNLWISLFAFTFHPVEHASRPTSRARYIHNIYLVEGWFLSNLYSRGGLLIPTTSQTHTHLCHDPIPNTQFEVVAMRCHNPCKNTHAQAVWCAFPRKGCFMRLNISISQ